MKPSDRSIPGTRSNLSHNLGSSEFDENETLALHSNYLYQDLPKSIEEALSSPEWHRAMKAEYEYLQNTEVRELVEMLYEKHLVTA